MAAFCKKLLTTSGLVKQTPRYCSNSISALGSQNAHQDEIDANISPMSLEKIPFRRDYSQEKCDLRRSWVEQYTGASMKNVSNWWKEDHSPDILKGNIEQPIGTIAIPLAVAGPLQINGEQAKGKFLAPLSTTEGALVASISRGAVVLNESGGVSTYTSQQRMSRCPVFTTDSPAEAVALGEWVKSKIGCIQEEVVAKHSKHSKLKDVITAYDMKYVHVLLSYETGDASGQNTTSLLSWETAKWITAQAPVRVNRFWVESGLSGDKRCSHVNAVIGRGLTCGAEAIIPEQVINKTLHTTAESMTALYNVLHRISDRAHSMGCNGNVANVIGAMFPALGQDIANLIDSSMAKLHIERHDGPGEGIKASMMIPSLVIGTVGGGTNLPTQMECLKMIGCHGEGKVRKLGEIIAAYSLALDISTVAAVSAGEFVAAHENLGRNKPT